MKLTDRIGHQYGRLHVIARAPNRSQKDTNARWACKCSCGNVTIQYGQDLQRGKVVSCGCWNAEKRTSHGKSRTLIYGVWKSMIDRCENSNTPAYKNYGARGISVSDEWHKFENFYSDMGDTPRGKSLDRIDVNRGYSKENCKWSTQLEQMRNTRVNRMIEFNGELLCLSAWAERFGLSACCLFQRLHRGLSIEEAFVTPKRRAKPKP